MYKKRGDLSNFWNAWHVCVCTNPVNQTTPMAVTVNMRVGARGHSPSRRVVKRHHASSRRHPPCLVAAQAHSAKGHILTKQREIGNRRARKDVTIPVFCVLVLVSAHILPHGRHREARFASHAQNLPE